MGFSDKILRIFAAVSPTVPLMLVCLAATAVLMAVLLIWGDMVWINQKKFKVFGIFYGLNAYDCIRLAVSWLRLVMTVAIVLMFRELSTIHYIVYAAESIIFILDVRRPARIFKNAVWCVLQLLGTLAVNLLCGYMKSMMYVSVKYWIVYVLLAIFLCAFSIFIFINELGQISSDRIPVFEEGGYGRENGRKESITGKFRRKQQNGTAGPEEDKA